MKSKQLVPWYPYRAGYDRFMGKFYVKKGRDLVAHYESFDEAKLAMRTLNQRHVSGKTYNA